MDIPIYLLTETFLNTGDPVEAGSKPGYIRRFKFKERPMDERTLFYTRDGPRREYDWYNREEQMKRIIGFSAGMFRENEVAEIMLRDNPPE